LLRGLKFDKGFDDLAREFDAPVAVWQRLGIAAVFAVLLWIEVGWRSAAGWLALQLVVDLWRRTIDPHGDQATTGARRLNRLANAFVHSLAWTALPILFWRNGQRTLQIVAIVQIASQLLLLTPLAFRSLIMTAACATPFLVCIVWLPLFDGGLHGWQLVCIGLTVLLTPFNFLLSARFNRDAAKALEAAHASLMANHAQLEAQTERAQAANRAKSVFLAMMSHELRTPMNGLLGMAHVLKRTTLDADQAEYVEMMVRSGDSLMVLLNDVLDVSKIEAGKFELESIVFDLFETARQAHHIWRDAASEKGVALALDIAPDTPRWVRGDPTRLRQILINLLSNAVKFTPRGEVRLSLRLVEQSEAAARIEAVVSDNGPGIPEHKHAHLFEAFSQEDTSISRRFGGTGLGLAISRHLAQLMGGEISLESELGKGSTFRVQIELALPLEIDAAPERDATACDISGLRVLVVDDNAVNLVVAATLLEAVGAEASTVSDAAAALQLLGREMFGLVLMDIHMPGMDGIEALGRIRAGQAGPPDIPVIALTADAMAGVEATLLSVGFDAVQAKPINPQRLVLAIGAVLAGRCGGAAPGYLSIAS
jgi:signal transduction histidine kinase/CheY-like chemotaxis protein